MDFRNIIKNFIRPETKFIFFWAVVVILVAWVKIPHGNQCYGGPPFYVNCDASWWFAITKDLSSFSWNILKHRPLFGIISWVIYQPLNFILSPLSSHFSFVNEYVLLNMVWRLENIVLFLVTLFLAYFAALKTLKNKRVALIFTLLFAVSSHTYAWLLQPLNNIGGFMILYSSWFMLVDYIQEENSKYRSRKLILYSIIYGILMLGKAQYNIWASIGLATVFLNPKRIKEFIIFTIIQTFPVLGWMLALKIEGINYANYEMDQGAFTWAIDQVKPFSLLKLMALGHSIVSSITGMVYVGLGTISFVILWIYSVLGLRTKMGKFIFIYLITTGVFLYLVRFTIPRHAPDVAPIVYLGVASILERLFSTIKKPINFYFLLSLFFAGLFWFNTLGQVVSSRTIF